MATVAVTGATGFIGGRIIDRLLRQGVQVRALTRRAISRPATSPATPAPEQGLTCSPATPAHEQGLTWIRGSLDDDDALRALIGGADALVHCAGLVKARNRAEFFAANADAVRRLAAIAASASPDLHLVHLSSLAAREPSLSDYAASKAAGEEILRENAAGLGWTILRPPAVYGPGDREILKLFKSLRLGLAFLPGGGARHASVIHVDDLSAAVTAVLASPGPESPASGRTFELDDGRPGGYELAEIYALAAELLDKRLRTITVAPQVLTFAARANRAIAHLRGRAPMVTPGKIAELLHPDWVARSPNLAETGLWRPEISLRDGLAATLQWYRSEGYL